MTPETREKKVMGAHSLEDSQEGHGKEQQHSLRWLMLAHPPLVGEA